MRRAPFLALVIPLAVMALAAPLGATLLTDDATTVEEAPIVRPTAATTPVNPLLMNPGIPDPAPQHKPPNGPPQGQPNHTPTGSDPGPGTGLGQDPFFSLLDRVLDEDATPQTFVGAVRDYYAGLGWNTPMSRAGSEGDDGTFDEENIVTYSYDVGDVNGDGKDDIALDIYCVNEVACNPSVAVGNTRAPLGGKPICGPPHRVQIISGTNGSLLWEERLDRPFVEPTTGLSPPANQQCAQEFLVGTVPAADGHHNILVYRYAAIRVSNNWVIRHNIYLLDPVQQAKTWDYPAEGLLVYEGNTRTWYADNFLVNPHLQVPPQEGVRLLPAATQSALHLQGVGFIAVQVNTPVAIPGMSGTLPIAWEYQPDEWAAKIDLETGDEKWHKDTFQLDLELSVVPQLLHVTPPHSPTSGIWYSSLARSHWYWNYQTCCFDQTGDGVPDLTYTTFEYTPYLSTNFDGPYFIRARLIVYDGETGDRKWEQTFQEGTSVWTSGWTVQRIGDATGDGLADILLHEYYYKSDYRHNVSLRSGADGAQVWKWDERRDFDILVLGDADGDGGNDFAAYMWDVWEFPSNLFGPHYEFYNVTATPIVMYRGATSETLWEATTFTAAVDLNAMFREYRINGLPDLDADGVGDIHIDEPRYYVDQTVAHHLAFISGRDAAAIHNIVTVGAFAFPILGGDLTGDGRDDLLILNGDIVDLWFTAYDGVDGEAEWSRRLIAMRVASYQSAVPLTRVHFLSSTETPQQDVVVTMQFEIVTAAGGFGADYKVPQVAAYTGPNGSRTWSIPALDDAVSPVLAGPSPLSAAYAAAIDGPAVAQGIASWSPTTRYTLSAGLFAVGGLAGFVATQWRRKA